MKYRLIATLLALAPLTACANQMTSREPGLGSNLGDRASYAASVPGTGPNCPALDFHVTQTGTSSYGGLVFDPVMTGMMSTLSGTMAPDGTLSLTMTPMVGHSGPSGTLTGRVNNGVLRITMAGGACALNNIALMPVAMTRGNAG